jgi:hypothetical protein
LERLPATCTSSAAPCAEHATPAVDPTAAVLRALTAARWDVELHNTGTTARVTLRPPVSWEGEPLEVHGPTLDEAVGAAWRRALLEEPGLVVVGRMAAVP